MTATPAAKIQVRFAAAVVLAVMGIVCTARVAPAQEVDASVAPATNIERQPLRRQGSSAPAGSTTTRPTTQKAAAARSSSNANGIADARQVAFALAGVVALILLLGWIIKRVRGGPGGGRANRAVQVLSRSPISPRQQLVLLRVGRRLLVVADGGGQMHTLSEITDPDEVAALVGQLQDDHNDRAKSSFYAAFGKMRGSYGTDADADDGDNKQDDSRANATEAEPALQRRGGDLGDDADDPAVASARRELSGLMDRVRSLSRQFKGS